MYYKCTVCNFFTKRRDNWVRHLKSQKHLSKKYIYVNVENNYKVMVDYGNTDKLVISQRKKQIYLLNK